MKTGLFSDNIRNASYGNTTLLTFAISDTLLIINSGEKSRWSPISEPWRWSQMEFHHRVLGINLSGRCVCAT